MKLIRSAVVAATAIAALIPSAVAFAADSTADSSASSASAAQPHHDWATPIGALRTKSSYAHNCSGSVIQSPAGDVVLTAAHCVFNKKPGSLTFYPDYANGHANSAYGGAWQVASVVVPPQYTAWRNSHPAPAGQRPTNPYDFAFLVLKNNKAHSIQWYTGALSPQIKPYVNNMPVTIAGYPTNSAGRVQCTGKANGAPYQGNWYVRMDCPSAPIPGGTSGGPWITVGTNTVVGIVGGYQEGGDSAYIEYSPWFQDTFAAYYNQAK